MNLDIIVATNKSNIDNSSSSNKEEMSIKDAEDINITTQDKNKDVLLGKKRKSQANGKHTQDNNEKSKEEEIDGNKPKVKKNRTVCSICREGGELILCERCPKSFHANCIKIKDYEEDKIWYCADCVPVIERMNKRREEVEQRKKIKEEKRKAKPEKQVKIEPLTTSPTIATISTQEPIIYDGNRLFDGDISSELNSFSLEKLNEIDFIIDEIIKKDKVKDYIVTYLNKAKEEGIQVSKYKPVLNTAKKKKRKKLNLKRKGLTQLKLSFKDLKDTKQKGETVKRGDAMAQKKQQEERKFLNIRYPIDDSELYSKYKQYKLEEKYLFKFPAEEMIIPDNYFLKVYKIYDFTHTFHEILKISMDFSSEMLYLSLLSTSLDNSSIVNEVVFSLLGVLIDYIMEEEMKEQEENQNQVDQGYVDKEFLLINTLFSYTKQRRDKVLSNCFIDVIKTIVFSDKFSLMSTEILKKRISSLNNSLEFFALPTDDKLQVINFLICCCLDTTQIKEQIQNDILQKTQLKRERADLELEIRSLDSKKRELERAEKQAKPREQIELLNQKLQNLTEENEHLGRKDLMKKRKEIENEREDFRSMIKEMEDNDHKRAKLIIKQEKITADIFSLSNNSKRSIGFDGLDNQYFIFRGKNNLIRIHIKSKLAKWGVYNSYEKISKLLETLTEKGKKEKLLIDKIRAINSKLISNDLIDPNDKNLLIELNSNWKNDFISLLANSITNHKQPKFSNASEAVFIFESLANKDQNELFKDRQISSIIENIVNIEKTVNDNLFKDNKEWDEDNIRSEFIAYCRNIKSVEGFIKAFELMNESFKNPLIIKHKQQKVHLHPKIISDEYEEELKFPLLIDDYNNLITQYKQIAIEKNSEYKKKASTADIWKDFLSYDLENHYLERLKSSKSLQEILLLSTFFLSLINYWSKSFKKNNWKAKDDKADKPKESNDLIFEDYILDDSKLRTRRQLKNYSNADDIKETSKENMILSSNGRSYERKKMIVSKSNYYIL